MLHVRADDFVVFLLIGGIRDGRLIEIGQCGAFTRTTSTSMLAGGTSRTTAFACPSAVCASGPCLAFFFVLLVHAVLSC